MCARWGYRPYGLSAALALAWPSWSVSICVRLAELRVLTVYAQQIAMFTRKISLDDTVAARESEKAPGGAAPLETV